MMEDYYSHIDKNTFYIVENILGPEDHSIEYEQLSNNFNSQVTDCCNCETFCTYPTCKCLQKSCGDNYIARSQRTGLIKLTLNYRKDSPIFECNENCSCRNNCGNCVVQKGPIGCLEIRPCEKGLGLFTKCFIPKGTFICEYAGELITKSQAAARHKLNLTHGKMNYIFCLKEHSGDSVVSTFVDPSVFGNVGRYMNHSCEPNCHIVPVRCDNPLPKLAIFSSVDVLKNNELTFHYGDSDSKDSLSECNRIKCLCNSKNCSGFMPFYNY